MKKMSLINVIIVCGILILTFIFCAVKIHNQSQEREKDLEFWRQHENWSDEAQKKEQQILLEGDPAFQVNQEDNK